jgi:putative transposase
LGAIFISCELEDPIPFRGGDESEPEPVSFPFIFLNIQHSMYNEQEKMKQTINKNFRFLLRPTEEQNGILLRHGGSCRFVWNHLVSFLRDRKERTGKFPTECQLAHEIVPFKKAHPFLKDVHSQPLHVAARRLTRTIRRAFSVESTKERNRKIAEANQESDPVKKAKKLARALNLGFPKYKAKRDRHDSIFYPQNFKIRRGRIHLAKIGWINFVRHRSLEGKPKTVSVVQDGDRWMLTICCELDIEVPNKKPLDEANIVGIDLGLSEFAVLSDGTRIPNPRTLKKHMKKLKREQRRLSRKAPKEDKPRTETVQKTEPKKEENPEVKPRKVYSKNYVKQLSKVQKEHRKVRNIRLDFLHKLTHRLTAKYDWFCMETLDIKGMLGKNNKGMNRSTTDVSWYAFSSMLEYKSEWRGKRFVQIGKRFPSTQRCSGCGGRQEMPLNQRTYRCPHCGLVMDRDSNSSLVILGEGLRMLREKEEKQDTVATTGINACGLDSMESRAKQEKAAVEYQSQAHPL